MDLITPSDLDRWGACDRRPGERYGDARLRRLLHGRPGWTPLEVSLLRSVPPEDRVWVLLRPEVLGAETCARLAHRWADRAVRQYARRCGVPAVEAWARCWLSGADRSAVAARTAGWTAGWAAARTAGWAAETASWAAEAAAGNAAEAAAWAAERRRQLADIRRELRTAAPKERG